MSIEETLRKINDIFLPIGMWSQVANRQKRSTSDHFEDLASKADMIIQANPILIAAIIPIMYNVDDWHYPMKLGSRTPPEIGGLNYVEDLGARIAQQLHFRNLRPNPSLLTEKVTVSVADHISGGRVSIVVQQGEQPELITAKSAHETEGIIIEYAIPATLRMEVVKNAKISTRLSPSKCRCALDVGSKSASLAWKDLIHGEVAGLHTSIEEPDFWDTLLAHLKPRIEEYSLLVDDQWSLLYVFSNVVDFHDSNGSSQKGLGGLFVLAKRSELRSNTIGPVLKECMALSDKLAVRIIHQAQLDEVERHATAAAISQVLARTMSHNLGSHSLNALATEQAMSALFAEIECRQRYDVCIPGRIVERVIECSVAEKSCVEVMGAYVSCSAKEDAEISKNRRELLARYNNYLRERMDFLADITTAVPAFETRTHFKDDLLKGYAENHLLTTTIAGSPSFDYCWKLEGDDTLVAIPSDVLGRHAFYVILENIVRNSAKHGAHSGTVEYTITVKSDVPLNGEPTDLVEVTIQDNKRRSVTKKTERDEYKKSANKIVNDRNCDIDKEVLENGRVRDGAWGMLEMKACAAYLRRIALEELDEDKYKTGSTTDLPLLKAVGSAEGFGYTFYLQKPRRILFTGPAREKLLVNKNDSELRNVGFLATKFEAIGKSKDNYLHRLWCHVHTKENAAALAKLVAVLLADPARFPHQVLVVCDGAEASVDAICAGLDDEWKKALVKRTVMVVSISDVPKADTETSTKWDEELYTAAMQEWLKGSIKAKAVRLPDTPYLSNVHVVAVGQAATEGASPMLVVDYAHHGEGFSIYQHLSGDRGITKAVEAPVNIEEKLFQSWGRMNKPIMVPYASGVARWMDREVINHKDDLSLHHLDYWMSEIAIVDERIQRAAHESSYSLISGEQVWVKHLLDVSSVRVPPVATVDLNEQEYTEPMWNGSDGLLPWLQGLKVGPDYMFVHLGILEKFKSCMPKTPADLLGELRSELPGTRIIVVSGRGKPSELPDHVCFLSYSALNQYVTQHISRSPFLLHELARCARRIQKA